MWKVSDEATKDLMISFYSELLKRKDVSSSFKEAQIRIREKYPDPYYWGAFKLIGK
jgi:CHAT domain-containing protein